MAKLKFHKGLRANLPSSGYREGEYYQCTDTGELFLALNSTELIPVRGGGGGNLAKLIFDKDYSFKERTYIIKSKLYEYSPVEEQTELLTFEESQEYTFPNSENGYRIKAFMVNGGNGGSYVYGGKGGNTKEIDISGASNKIQINIGNGGAAKGLGKTTSVEYEGVTYACDAQTSNSGTGVGADGVAAPLWTERSELFGASGGAGLSSSVIGARYAGGTTGGGTGGLQRSYDYFDATPGTFYGAGGGGGYQDFYSVADAAAGYQGVVILQVTYGQQAKIPLDSTQCKGIVYVNKEQWQTLLDGGTITDGTITHSYDKDYLYAVNVADVVEDAPNDDKSYVRKSKSWVPLSAGLSETVVLHIKTDSGSLSSATVLVKNKADESEIHTLNWTGQDLTFIVPAEINYTVSFSVESGFRAPATMEYLAIADTQRNITATYQIFTDGIYIGYTDGSISSYSILTPGKTPEGVVIKNSYMCILLHPSEGINKIWSNNTSTIISGVTTTYDPYVAQYDYAGKINTDAVIASGLAGSAFTFARDLGADWYLPACGEMIDVMLNRSRVNTAMELIGGTLLTQIRYWTSTQGDDFGDRDQAWVYYYRSASSPECEEYRKDFDNRCRAVRKFQ